MVTFNHKLPQKFSLVLVVLSFLIAIYAYQHLDNSTIASHWGINGEVNGYMSKFWGLFLVPFTMLGIFVLFLIIPLIDPLKHNIQKFRTFYNRFVFVIILFIFYVYMLTIIFNLGYVFNMTLMIIPSMGLLFFYMGTFLERIERNWFIGIRTPWTISNDIVWKKTHLLASKIFRVEGVIIFLSIFLPASFWIIFATIFASIIWIVVYSYILYRNIQNK